MILDIVSAVLVVLAVLDWAATVVLIAGARRLHEPALTERAIAATILSIAASGVAFLGAARLTDTTLPAGVSTTVLILSLLAVSMPQLLWIGLYWRGRFG